MWTQFKSSRLQLEVQKIFNWLCNLYAITELLSAFWYSKKLYWQASHGCTPSFQIGADGLGRGLNIQSGSVTLLLGVKSLSYVNNQREANSQNTKCTISPSGLYHLIPNGKKWNKKMLHWIHLVAVLQIWIKTVISSCAKKKKKKNSKKIKTEKPHRHWIS